jgi:hypothetical protein
MSGPLHLAMRDRPALSSLINAMAKLSRPKRDEIARMGRKAKAGRVPRLRRLASAARAEAKRLAGMAGR